MIGDLLFYAECERFKKETGVRLGTRAIIQSQPDGSVKFILYGSKHRTEFEEFEYVGCIDLLQVFSVDDCAKEIQKHFAAAKKQFLVELNHKSNGEAKAADG